MGASTTRASTPPLLQIALALGSGAGQGDIDSAIENFAPRSDLEVGQAVTKVLNSDEEPGRLAFLRRDLGKPAPGTFVVTERPEGFWLLEHSSFMDFLAG